MGRGRPGVEGFRTGAAVGSNLRGTLRAGTLPAMDAFLPALVLPSG